MFKENAAFRDLYKCEPKGARNGYVRMGGILVSFSYMETANVEKRFYSNSSVLAIFIWSYT